MEDRRFNTQLLLKDVVAQVKIEYLRQIKGGVVLVEAIQRSCQKSTDPPYQKSPWPKYSEHQKHVDSPSWGNYMAHAKTIKE